MGNVTFIRTYATGTGWGSATALMAAELTVTHRGSRVPWVVLSYSQKPSISLGSLNLTGLAQLAHGKRAL
jgi:hypothetical protein